MVKKHIFTFTGDNISDVEKLPTMHQSQVMNDHLHKFLAQHKDHISDQYFNKKWDKYKKFANDYELVFTSCYGFPSISIYNSISRSFFKLWEILHDFEDQLHFKQKKCIKGVFLAEGPGGFIEAFCKYRCTKQCDSIFGITLLNPADRNIPNWKLPVELYEKYDIKLLTGDDGTGSMYNVKNIDNYVENIGGNVADIVTADGGFDFSNDFNNQEEQSMHLVICEIYTALRVQAVGGFFVLKIYDIRTLNTMRILKLLHEHYDHVNIVKPLSSRPANSEKYLVCTGFKGPNVERLQILRQIIQYSNMGLLSTIDIPNWFINQAVHYNVFYITKQVVHIHKTLTLIQCQNYKNNGDAEFVRNLKNQLDKAIRWCNKYNMQTSLEALHKYNEYYVGH
jgi:23S rRNA U2552 (ribose-2'-O)-methylase RlmE/FtsJ